MSPDKDIVLLVWLKQTTHENITLKPSSSVCVCIYIYKSNQIILFILRCTLFCRNTSQVYITREICSMFLVSILKTRIKPSKPKQICPCVMSKVYNETKVLICIKQGIKRIFIAAYLLFSLLYGNFCCISLYLSSKEASVHMLYCWWNKKKFYQTLGEKRSLWHT